MRRTELRRKTPLKARSWGVSAKPRTALAKSGKVKADRKKRQRNHYASKYWKTMRSLCWQRDQGMCTAKACLHPTRHIEGMEAMELAHKTNARFGHENLDDVGCEHGACNLEERRSRAWYAGRIT